MTKPDKEKVILAEHILEVRHVASGSFLDLKGHIADYIRSGSVFPYWQIETGVINFRDKQDRIETEGAFVGYKSAGYIVLNPPTRNYFVDRATAFWKVLTKNKDYVIPAIERFGARTKAFLPSNTSFEEINKIFYEHLMTEKARSIIGDQEKDLQITVELRSGEFDIKVVIGPVHPDEASAYFQFKSDHFAKAGLFLDLDYYALKKLEVEKVPSLLELAEKLAFDKIEKIAGELGV